jgi:glutamine amidotransferase
VCLLENTHPFTRELWGRYWTFAHNGQLTGYKRLPTGRHRPVGDTDSEHAFCWLLDRLEHKYPKRPANFPAMFRYLATLCDELRGLGCSTCCCRTESS